VEETGTADSDKEEHDVLRHRIGLSYEAEASNVNTEGIVSDIINKVQVP